MFLLARHQLTEFKGNHDGTILIGDEKGQLLWLLVVIRMFRCRHAWGEHFDHVYFKGVIQIMVSF